MDYVRKHTLEQQEHECHCLHTGIRLVFLIGNNDRHDPTKYRVIFLYFKSNK